MNQESKLHREISKITKGRGSPLDRLVAQVPHRHYFCSFWVLSVHVFAYLPICLATYISNINWLLIALLPDWLPKTFSICLSIPRMIIKIPNVPGPWNSSSGSIKNVVVPQLLTSTPVPSKEKEGKKRMQIRNQH